MGTSAALFRGVTSPLTLFTIWLWAGTFALRIGGGGGVALLLALGIIGWTALRGAHTRWRGVVALWIVAVLTGSLRGRVIPDDTPRARLAVETTVLAGRVIEGCVPDGDHDRCLVRRDDGGMVSLHIPNATCAAEPGDRVRATVLVHPLAPSHNGGRLGPGAGMFRRGIVATATGIGCAHDHQLGDAVDLARRVGLRVRLWLARSLAGALPDDSAIEAHTLLFGDEAALDRDDLDAFRRSGLSHLLAVSGAHVSLLMAVLAGFVEWALRRVPRVAVRGIARSIAVAVALPFVAGFVLATGESASSMRAWVACLLTCIATWTGRTADGESVVASSALITLMAQPACAFDAGWQLSVAAAWALSVKPARADDDDAPRPAAWHRWIAPWREAMASSLRVACVVAPVVAWHFQTVPLTALVANVLAAPLAETVALPSVLAVAVLGGFTRAGAHAVGRVIVPVLAGLFRVPGLALRLPFATWSAFPPNAVQGVVLFVTALLWPRWSWRARGAALCLAAVAIFAAEWHLRAAVHPRGRLRITALDVGQGDALLVDLPDGSAMLIDGGGSPHARSEVGTRVVIPFLADRRRRDLAAVVATHPHPDHIGGLVDVLAWGRVGALWDTRQGETWVGAPARYAELRSVARARGVPVLGPEALCGSSRPFHGVRIEVLAPCPAVPVGTPPNDGSFVLRMTYGRASVLFPGDLERDGERRVLERIAAPVTVLKVGHHGSRTSTTSAWLDRLRPTVALVSAGNPSPYGHPHTDVLQRLEARGIAILSTATRGAVQVTLDAEGNVATGVAE